MEQSLFSAWVQKWFKPIVAKVVEKVNGTKLPATYLFKSMLRKEYSPTLKWSSINIDGATVAADVVSMDSPLPLKKRDSISKADGDIPKLGMKLALNERTMTDLGILRRTQGQDSQIVAKLFADTAKSITGVYERLEYMFLQALSTGITLVPDTETPGLGVRVDFKYPAANKFGVTTVWSDVSSKPLDDFDRVKMVADANGDQITTILMDDYAFNNLKKTTQIKEQYGMFLGMSIGSGAVLPVPNLAKVNEMLMGNYGWTIKLVNRTVKTEKNGTRTNRKPWAEGAVVLLTSEEVGVLAWGTLAEMEHRAKQVDYVVADDYILVSKYHTTDPLKEFTASQALVLPVINNVDEIYLLDSKTVQA